MEKETTKAFDYANRSSIDVELNCVQCNDPFTDPVIVNCCEQILCRQCVIVGGDSGDGVVCPLCSQCAVPFSNPPRLITNMLARIEVSCNSCGAIVKRDAFEAHRNNCVNAVVRCAASDVGCKHETRRGEMGEHEQACQLVQQRPLLLRIRELESKVESLDSRNAVISELESKVNLLENHNDLLMESLEKQKRQSELETRTNEQVLERSAAMEHLVAAMESRLKLVEIEERNRRARKKIKLIGTKYEAFPVAGYLRFACVLEGNILAGDSAGKAIQVLSPTGQLIRSFGSQGDDGGSLDTPRGVCVLNDGTIAVSEFGDGRIVIFSATGEFIRSIDKGWGWGSSNGYFSCPFGVCALGGNLVIANFGNSRIQIVTPTGEFVRAFGSKGNAAGSLDGPAGICVLDGNIVVTDQFNNRIQIFSATGEFIRAFGSKGSGEGQFAGPYGVCILDGCIVVADTGNHRIQFFSATGEFIRAYGSKGNENGCFFSPRGVCVLDDGRLVVTEVNRMIILA